MRGAFPPRGRRSPMAAPSSRFGTLCYKHYKHAILQDNLELQTMYQTVSISGNAGFLNFSRRQAHPQDQLPEVSVPARRQVWSDL